MQPVDKTNQLLMKRRGLIITFKHKRSGDMYALPISHARALVFGGLKYIYVNEYTPIPHPIGRPPGSKNKPKEVL